MISFNSFAIFTYLFEHQGARCNVIGQPEAVVGTGCQLSYTRTHPNPFPDPEPSLVHLPEIQDTCFGNVLVLPLSLGSSISLCPSFSSVHVSDCSLFSLARDLTQLNLPD